MQTHGANSRCKLVVQTRGADSRCKLVVQPRGATFSANSRCNLQCKLAVQLTVQTSGATYSANSRYKLTVQTRAANLRCKLEVPTHCAESQCKVEACCVANLRRDESLTRFPLTMRHTLNRISTWSYNTRAWRKEKGKDENVSFREVFHEFRIEGGIHCSLLKT